MRRYVIALVLLAPSALAQTAQAGVATLTRDCSSLGGCNSTLRYDATADGAAHIVARSVHGGVLLTDSSRRIDNRSEACTLRTTRSLFCAADESVDTLVLEGGDRGAVIDARRFSGSATITGGRGRDSLYAAHGGSSTLTGGGGYNLLVGNRRTTVSFDGALGPVTVDLAKGFAVAPSERDRIVGVGRIVGGAGTNRLFGRRTGGGELQGGSGRNVLVSRAPDTQISLATNHRPGTVVCTKGTFVYGMSLSDTLLGPCRMRGSAMQMLGPLRSLDSRVLEIFRNTEVTTVTMRAVKSGEVIGSLTVSPGGPAPSYCRLSQAGQRLLRRAGHVRVRIEVLAAPDYRGDEHFFSTVLRSPRP